MNGIYIHIPFCKSKCPYCDFHSQRCDKQTQKNYVDALVNEITTLNRSKEFLPPDFKKQPVSTIYFGGGTPSVLDGVDFEKILTEINKNFAVTDNAEITVEVNPASHVEELIPYFKKLGVNRVSLGMQSAVDEERKVLGRSSDRERVKEVINLLKDNGIHNISLDVMLGIPLQTKESLRETLDFVIERHIKHVSAYILKIEEGTFFYNHRERYSFPSEDDTCDLYEFCSEYLESRGFEHYEISNFAIKGFESIHNTKYWTLENYWGIGAAAHSCIDGKRFFFESDTQGFIDGEKAIFDCLGNDAQEYVMLGLRLKKGINIKELSALYGNTLADKILKKVPPLQANGLVDFNGETLHLTKRGFLLSNTIINQLI